MVLLKLTSSPSGPDKSTFEVGENLFVMLTGLNANELYTVLISYNGNELYNCKYYSTSAGVAGPETFWSKLGMDNPNTGVLYTYAQAQTQWQGKQLDFTIIDSSSTTVLTRSITISTSPTKPFFVGTDASGVMTGPLLEGSDTLYAGIYNLAAGDYRLFLVDHQYIWEDGDRFTVCVKPDNSLCTVDFTVTPTTSSSGMIVQVVLAADTLLGSYDFIIRPMPSLQADEALILVGDKYAKGDVKAVVTRQSANGVPRCCAQEVEITGRPDNEINPRKMFFSNTFKVGDNLHASLTPLLFANYRRYKKCAIYIVPHIGFRANGSTLNHVLNSPVKEVQLDANSTFNPTLIWESVQILNGVSEYDVILDFGNNPANAANFVKDGKYDCPLDLIDGYYLFGFKVVTDDPGDITTYDNVGVINYGGITAPPLVQDYNEAFFMPLPSPLTVDRYPYLRGQIYFPSLMGSPTTLADIATGSHPVIVLVHGVGHDYTYYDGLLRHFAKNGFIAITIDSGGNSTYTLAKANLVKLNLDKVFTLFANANKSASIQNNIGLIGHSQGGEAVVLAKRLSKFENWTYHINAVASLAPSDANGYEYIGTYTDSATPPVTTDWRVPYFVMYGSQDGFGGVVGGYNSAYFPPNPVKNYRGSGFSLYDKSFGIEKSMLFIYGATHNRFLYSGGGNVIDADSNYGQLTEEEWKRTIDNTYPMNGIRDVSIPSQVPKAHHTVAEAYFNAFFRLHLMADTRWKGIFKGEWTPPTVEKIKTTPFGNGMMKTYIQYENHSNSADYSEVDFFERQLVRPAPPAAPVFSNYSPSNPWGTPTDEHGNVVFGTVTANLPSSGTIEENYSGYIGVGNNPTGLDFYSPHRTGALKIKWQQLGSAVHFSFPAPVYKNISEFTHVSFRAAQTFYPRPMIPPDPSTTPDVNVNPRDKSVSFSVTLVDYLNRSKNLRIYPFGALPYPYERTDNSNSFPSRNDLTKTAMITVRIPLAEFLCPDGTLDFTKIFRLSFYFSENRVGEILIDSIEFTKS